MITYSIDKGKEGDVVIFMHCRIGVIPLLYLRDQVQLVEFIDMLKECQTDIPQAFKEAID